MTFIRFLLALLGGSYAGFQLDERDMQLKDGEDVNAAVDRVLQKMRTDHETASHKKLAKRREALQANDVYKAGLGGGEVGGGEEEFGEYFRNYESVDIHRTMILDEYRVGQYKKALEAVDLRGKTVVDFGCGSGILSIFAARGKAEKVWCVEKSRIREKTKKIVNRNGFSDVISVVSSIADVPLANSADVLVSEWMGYLLLTEDVIGDFFHARDTLLNPDTGVLIPSAGVIHAQPVSDPAWWDFHVNWARKNEWQIDFSDLVVSSSGSEPHNSLTRFQHFGVFQNQKLLGGKKDWSCGRHSRRDHKFRHVTDDWHGFLLTFDVKLYADVWLKTGPSKGQSAMGKWTHWGHVFWPRPFNSTVGNGLSQGEDLEMSAVVKRAKLHAHEVELRYWWHGEMVTMREPELLAETVEAEDAFQNKRLYTAMLAAKGRRGGGGGGEERKAKRKEEL